VDGVADPVDASIATDSLVGGVDEDDLEVLVDTILVDPVRVENAHASATTGNTLLGGRAKGTLELEVVDSLVGGLSERSSCRRAGESALMVQVDRPLRRGPRRGVRGWTHPS
jgi:hypothetical protein